MKKKIWIFQTGEPLHIDGDNYQKMRATCLADELIIKNYDITVISSNFFHQEKRFRFKHFKEQILREGLKFVLIHSLGYYKNLSIQRIIDHFYLGINLKKYLKSIKKEDLPNFVFIGYPPIETAFFLTKWLKEKEIPFFIDIKDAWPETFYWSEKNIFLKVLINFFCIPYKYMSLSILKKADGVVSISKSFLNFQLNKIKRKKRYFDTICYLTKPKIKIEKYTNLISKYGINHKDIIIYFAGNISFNFDFQTILISAQKTTNKNIKIVIAGEGELLKEIKNEVIKKDLKNFIVVGYLNIIDNNYFYQNSDYVIAPYKNTKDFQMTVSNKIIEAFQNNLPIITPLKGEVKDFIEKENLGIYYEEFNHEFLVSKFNEMKKNSVEYRKMKLSVKNINNIMFDHKTNYEKLSKKIDEIVS